MKAASVDYEVVLYSNTLHSFTNPLSNDPAHGVKYNPESDRRAWQAMQDFFNEIFKK
jgi:dienelactone hydrolase